MRCKSEMITDILKTDIDWEGQDVYVVGSGPNATPYMLTNSQDVPVECLPLYSIIIACNASVRCRNVPKVWLCATPVLAQLDWFNNAMRSYSVPYSTRPSYIVGRYGEWLKNYPVFTHYFHPGSSLWAEATRDAATNSVRSVTKYFGCTKGYLRGGASAVARGVQLAWFKRAKRCILIGADMKGRVYFDGTMNETKRNTMDSEGYWYELPFFNELIKWVKKRDMDVVSLTETALDVEVI